MEHLIFEANAPHSAMGVDRIFGGRQKPVCAVIGERGLAALRNVRGVQLRVMRGSIWITQSGSTDDVWLAAGESFRITRNGLTIVCAGHASPCVFVMVDPPVRAPGIRERLHNTWRAMLAQSWRPVAAAR